MNHYVYQITNNINGKIYIGKRSCKCDIPDDTYFGSGIRLNRAVKKYGKQNFTKTIIDICDSSKMAYELEALIVDSDFLKRTDTYNLCGGGIGCTCHSDETRSKISASSIGKIHSEETRIKLSNSHKGKIHSDESRAKISANHGLKGKTGELSIWFGKTHSDEARAKMSTNHINVNGKSNPFFGKHHSNETRNKISESQTGKRHSEETKAKISATRAANNLAKQTEKLERMKRLKFNSKI